MDEDLDRPRRIVQRAASKATSASEWFFRDERGTWEKKARELWEQTEAKRKALDLADEQAEDEIATRLLILALSAMISDARKREPETTADMVPE